MMGKLLNLTAAAVFVAAGSYAHEGHVHKLMGTVKAVHADVNHVEIAVAGGKTEGFYVDKDTKYLKGSTALALSDLKPGMRVVVETKMQGNKTVAIQVRAGATKAANRPSPQQDHH